jgi:hypothetical protein
MRRLQITALLVAAACLAVAANSSIAVTADAQVKGGTILKASDITPQIFPERVFYQGKTAPTEMRNTAGVHFPSGAYFLAGLVDSSGYSTAVKSKYQAYLLMEVPLRFGDKGEDELKPGAYGAGFVDGSFLITDLGAHDLFRVAAHRDGQIKRPIPLQVLPGATAGTYRLYRGRDYVEFRSAD